MFEKAEEMVFHGTLDDEPPAACRRDGRGGGGAFATGPSRRDSLACRSSWSRVFRGIAIRFVMDAEFEGRLRTCKEAGIE